MWFGRWYEVRRYSAIYVNKPQSVQNGASHFEDQALKISGNRTSSR